MSRKGKRYLSGGNRRVIKQVQRKDSMNYRDQEMSDRCCLNCEHKDKDQFGGCHIILTHPTADKVCNAWNSAEIENTWYMFMTTAFDTLYILVKEVEDTKVKTVVSEEIVFPVASVERKVQEILTLSTIQLGCPDVFVHMNPEKMPLTTNGLRLWLSVRSIEYREMEFSKVKADWTPGKNLTDLEKLSAIVDVWLRSEQE